MDIENTLRPSWSRGFRASMGLSFNINVQSRLKLHSEVVLPDGDSLEPALYQGLVDVFLVSEDFVDGAGPPFCFASAGENAVCFQTFCDPIHRIALQVFPVDALYHLCLFRIDDEIPICILGVAEEVIVIYLYLAILVAKLESQLHILAEGL